jgi:hypothetical protein
MHIPTTFPRLPAIPAAGWEKTERYDLPNSHFLMIYLFTRANLIEKRVYCQVNGRIDMMLIDL